MREQVTLHSQGSSSAGRTCLASRFVGLVSPAGSNECTHDRLRSTVTQRSTSVACVLSLTHTAMLELRVCSLVSCS
eukprot:1417247-Amphidinium_carterae.1